MSEPATNVSRPLIVGTGEVALEFLGRVQRFPEYDVDSELDEISVQVGGSGAIAIAAASALGCRTRFACKLADEFLGNFILTALSRAGIETRGVLAKDKVLSAVRFTTVNQAGEHLSFFSRGDVDELATEDLDLHRLLDGADALLLDGSSPLAQVTMAELAQARDTPVILDGSVMGPNVGDLVALADILLCSERYASELAPRDSLEQTLIDLQRLGPRVVVITLGSGGSIGLHGDQLVQQPAFPIDAVDTKYAGSVFHGAFAAALVNKLPFARCMEFASTAAGLACRTLGAWAGIPSRAEVVKAIRQAGF